MKRSLCLVALSAILAATPVFAAPGTTVVVLQPEPNDPVLAQALLRLENELRAAGFEVTKGPGPDHDPRWELEHASNPDTLVTITLRRAEGEEAVDLWVLDRLSGKTLIRRIHVPLDEPNAPTVLAVRTTELIRASLLEVTAQPASNSAPHAPVPSVVQNWMKPPSELFSGFQFQIGATTLYSYGLGAAFMPSIRVGFPSVGPLSVRALAASTVVAGSSVSSDGRADYDQQMFGVEALAAAGRTHTWVPFASLGAGAYHVRTAGQSTSTPYSNSEASAWALYGDAGLGLAFRTSESLTLIADLHAILLLPRERVMIGSTSAGLVGAPSWMFGLHAMFGL